MSSQKYFFFVENDLKIESKQFRPIESRLNNSQLNYLFLGCKFEGTWDHTMYTVHCTVCIAHS